MPKQEYKYDISRHLPNDTPLEVTPADAPIGPKEHKYKNVDEQQSLRGSPRTCLHWLHQRPKLHRAPLHLPPCRSVSAGKAQSRGQTEIVDVPLLTPGSLVPERGRSSGSLGSRGRRSRRVEKMNAVLQPVVPKEERDDAEIRWYVKEHKQNILCIPY